MKGKNKMEEMNEIEKMDDNFKAKVEEKVVDKLATNYKLTNDVTTFIARAEVLNIIVAILNAFLGERQKDDSRKLTDLEVGAIQAAVNAENAKTEELFKAIEAVMNPNKNEEF